ncbi:MAG: glycosyltransferase family protein [Candidatus Helarchaeales archaeon]
MLFKVGGLMMVYNEEEFLEPAILSILDFVNQLVIVEGACQKMYEITKSWSSTDDTVPIIKRIQKENDPNGKIKLIQGKWLDKREIQNHGLTHLEDDTNFLFVHGGDEVYKKKDLEILKKFVIEKSKIKKFICVRYPFIHFWHDLNHVAFGGIWDKYQLRFSKFRKSVCKFYVHYAVGDNNCKRLDDCNQYRKQGKIHVLNDIYIYHYGHAKSRKNQLNKFIFYRMRDHKDNRSVEEITETIKRKSGWWNWKGEVGRKAGVKLFTGTHPEVMKNHPRYIKEVLNK